MSAKRSNHFIFVICIIMVVGLIPNLNVYAKAKPKLTTKSKTISVGDTTTVILKNAGKTKWKSNNKSVITVIRTKKNKATVKAKKQGRATITATYKGKKYKITIKVAGKTKKDKNKKADEKRDNPVLNAGSVDLYYLSDDYMQYITYDKNHLREYRFRVSGTDKEVYEWSLEGEDSSFFNITQYGLVTLRWGPAYEDWSKEVTVKATLEDGRVLTAKVTSYSETNFYVDKLLTEFEKDYITDDMTDLEKVEKAAWYIGATTDYERGQESWIKMLIIGSGDCCASRFLLEKMCRHMGIGASGAYNFESHGDTMVKIDGKYYVITTGFNEPKPRGYIVVEYSEEDAKKKMKKDRITERMFELRR